MRRLLLTLCALPLLLGGCFVIDEIDAGMEIMDAHSPKRDEPEPEPAVAERSGGAPNRARDKLAQYYARQRARAASSTGPKAPEDMMVRCVIQGRSQYMRRRDCDLRGGRSRRPGVGGS